MNGVTLTIKPFQEKKRCRALLLIGVLFAAAAVVSMPLVAAGEPAAADLSAAEAVEETCAGEDEATAETCAEEEEAAAATVPAEQVESAPQVRAAQSATKADESCPANLGNDGFGVGTLDGEAGAADFVDYGEGKPGGGNNDDYIAIHDLANDNEGIKAYAWISGNYQGMGYNGKGSGSCVVWDPFPNVKPGECVGLMVCRANGPKGDPYSCGEFTQCSTDG